MILRENRRHKTKNHAQDGGMLSAMRLQHPAILPWFLVLGWRPSFRVSHGHLARFAQRAGLLLDVLLRTRSLRETVSRCFGSRLKDMTASALCPSRIIGSDKPNKPAHESIMQKRAPDDARVLH
jgi:hypothetical protein